MHVQVLNRTSLRERGTLLDDLRNENLFSAGRSLTLRRTQLDTSKTEVNSFSEAIYLWHREMGRNWKTP